MKNNKVKNGESQESKDLALHYMQPLVDVARESFLILDHDLRVILANPTFYQNFQVAPEQTEKVLLYELGNGQWNISALKSLLEEVLPEKKVVRDYEVKHTFETIGEKTILLNARQIAHTGLIILAMEDITVRKELEEKLEQTAKDLAIKVEQRASELADKRIKELEAANEIMVGRELKMVELKKEIEELKKQSK